MLTLLHSFLESYIDPYFAEIVYNWNELVLSIIGGVSTIVSYYFPVNSNSKHNTHFAAVVFLLFLTVTGYTYYCNQTYTRLPTVTYMADSYETVRQKLPYSSLRLKIDSNSQKQYQNDPNLSSSCFRVLFMSPAPGTFQKKDTPVTLYLTWSDKIYDTEFSTPSGLFSNQQLENMPTFHANQFTLCTHAMGALLLSHMESPLFNYSYLGADQVGRVSVTISLFNYESKQCVQSFQISLGDSVTFSDLPSGTYYYTAVADGYRSVISDHPFHLDASLDQLSDPCTWGLNMEPISSDYSPESKVRLVDAQNQPLANVSAELRLDMQDGSLIDFYDSLPVYTDENGIAMMAYSINSIPASYPLTVSLSNQYTLSASLLEQNSFHLGTFDATTQTWTIRIDS